MPNPPAYHEHCRTTRTTRSVLKMLGKAWCMSLFQSCPVRVAIIVDGKPVTIAEFHRGRLA